MRDFARRNAWILPVAFAALLAGIGWTSYQALEQRMKREIASKLETTRNTTISALLTWAQENKAVVDVHAARPACDALTDVRSRG